MNNTDLLQLAQSNSALFGLLIAFFSPNLVAVVQQPLWPHWLRSGVTVIASVIIGVGTAYFSGQFEAKTAITAILFALVVSTNAYEHVFKQSARSIELATSGVQLGRMGQSAPYYDTTDPAAYDDDGSAQSGDNSVDSPAR